MSTTIHLSPPLLESVDRRAGELGMSRNRYIARALERALETETRWSTGFVQSLKEARADIGGRRALDKMRAVITANRTRKAPPEL
jgi:predicted transcriptional regulator